MGAPGNVRSKPGFLGGPEFPVANIQPVIQHSALGGRRVSMFCRWGWTNSASFDSQPVVGSSSNLVSRRKAAEIVCSWLVFAAYAHTLDLRLPYLRKNFLCNSGIQTQETPHTFAKCIKEFRNERGLVTITQKWQ